MLGGIFKLTSFEAPQTRTVQFTRGIVQFDEITLKTHVFTGWEMYSLASELHNGSGHLAGAVPL